MLAPASAIRTVKRHRREHLSFDAGQRQDRQVDDRDDERAEQARPDDLARILREWSRDVPRGSSTRPSRCCSAASARRQFSTMITAPSTMMPKSIAPRLIRLALTLFSTMPVMVNSIDSGMTQAVAIAAPEVAQRQEQTTTTRSAPSKRFFSTVAIVASTRRVRS